MTQATIMTYSANASTLLTKIKAKESRIGVIGLGYVGLPLAGLLANQGFAVSGLDIDPVKIDKISQGTSYISYIPDTEIVQLREAEGFNAHSDMSRAGDCDVLILCVPTPLSAHREPDLTYIEQTLHSIAPHLQPDTLLILESTTYPGTTKEVVAPVLIERGFTIGQDIFLAYSPEREDPGNKVKKSSVPKLIGADDTHSLAAADALYSSIFDQTVCLSSAATAEAVKLTENIFRAVNIALVNELKQIYTQMDIDIWEVIDAASTKPYGYMPFYPGPGLGGHCIPIDPFYLTWKAREVQAPTRFIELAGEINTSMPSYVISRLVSALSEHAMKSINGAKVLVLGIAYKKNVDDLRESPGLKLLSRLSALGAHADFHDPLVPKIKQTRDYPDLTGLKSVDLTPDMLRSYDAALVVTDHDDIDFRLVGTYCPLIIDTRNALSKCADAPAIIVKA